MRAPPRPVLAARARASRAGASRVGELEASTRPVRPCRRGAPITRSQCHVSTREVRIRRFQYFAAFACVSVVLTETRSPASEPAAAARPAKMPTDASRSPQARIERRKS